MLTQDAIKKGKSISDKILLDKYLKRISDYNLNPTLCHKCKKPLPYHKRKYLYCSRSCSNATNNTFTKSKIKPKIIPPTTPLRHIVKSCKICNKILPKKNYTEYCYKCYRKLLSIRQFKERRDRGNYYPTQQKLRNYILFTRPYKCENCGMTKWLNQTITLEVHHIDGNHKHNNDDNLQLLCPNCHSLTNTYRTKNPKGMGKLRKKYIKIE